MGKNAGFETIKSATGSRKFSNNAAAIALRPRLDSSVTQLKLPSIIVGKLVHKLIFRAALETAPGNAKGGL